MRKLRSDSTFSGLPAGQRDQLLEWLFNGGMSYAEIAKRLRKEFGLAASESSLGRFYRHVAEERLLEGLRSPEGSVNDFRVAARKLLGMAMLQACKENNERRGKDGLKAVVALMRLMLRDQEMEMSEQRLALELQRFAPANTDKTAYRRIPPRIF